jgi:hypothetical protein
MPTTYGSLTGYYDWTAGIFIGTLPSNALPTQRPGSSVFTAPTFASGTAHIIGVNAPFTGAVMADNIYKSIDDSAGIQFLPQSPIYIKVFPWFGGGGPIVRV